MFDANPEKKCKTRSLSGASFMLNEEEHDQGCEKVHYLLIAQLHFDCQLKHGYDFVCAGRPANWLKVGFGGYEQPNGCAAWILFHLTVVLRSPPGINRRRLRFSKAAAGSQFLIHNVK